MTVPTLIDAALSDPLALLTGAGGTRRALLGLVASIALASCLDVPRSTTPQTPSDQRAADTALAAFQDARGPVECRALDRVDVISRPAEGLDGWCGRPAQSCVYLVQRYVGAPPSTLVYVRDDADARTRAALVVHEALHVARLCWVYGGDYDARVRTGSREGCAIGHGFDRAHCDAEVWTTIERDAIARWSAP